MTPKDIQALRDERAKLTADARTLVEKAEGEKRALDAEERKQYDKMFADIGTLKERIETGEQVLKEEAELAEPRHQTPAEKPNGTPTKEMPKEPEKRDKPADPGELRWQLPQTAWGAEGRVEIRERSIPFTNGSRNSPEYRSAFTRWCAHGERALNDDEVRALQADVETSGGAMVPDEMFVARLIKFKDNRVHLRQLGTVFMVTNSDSLGAPSLDADPADASWTSEIQDAPEDSTMAFGKRELHPWPSAKLLKVSRPLLRKSALPAEQIVRERLGYKFAVTEEKAFLTGTGANQPLGIFTADSNGISTSQDVSSGNTTTEMTFDGLINAKYTLVEAYRMSDSLRWIFHRDGIKQIAKIKDGNGQYIWQPSVQMGQPDRILNVPVIESEYAPSTFTTGLYVGMIGDFSFYWIADSLGMTVQRLDELYARTNQVGFIGRMETDGMPVLEEAFVRVTLA